MKLKEAILANVATLEKKRDGNQSLYTGQAGKCMAHEFVDQVLVHTGGITSGTAGLYNHYTLACLQSESQLDA